MTIPSKLALTLVTGIVFCGLVDQAFPQAPSSRRTVIAASTVLDGKGHILRDVRIVIEGSKIVAVNRIAQGPVWASASC